MQPSKIPFRNRFANIVPRSAPSTGSSSSSSSSSSSLYSNSSPSLVDKKILVDKKKQEFHEYMRSKREPSSSGDSKHGKHEKHEKDEMKTSYYQRKISVVNVDSRDRDLNIYAKPNEFEVFLGRTFYNIRSIKLVSIEFPNTDDVIKDAPVQVKNNVIAWSNEEDMDIDYPEYYVEIRSGTYSAVTLETELQTKMNSVKRRNGTGQFHYFLVSVNLDQNSVQFTSLDLRPLPQDPFEVVEGETIVTVYQVNHGFKKGDVVYITGAKSVAGISAVLLNTNHVIDVLSLDRFQFEVNTEASTTVSGGGTLCRAGLVSPFKLHFGRREDTLQKILGFPNEDSGVAVNAVDPIQSFVYPITDATAGPVTILRVENHGLFVGMKIKVYNLITVPPIMDGKAIYQIVSVPSSNEIGVNFSTNYVDVESSLAKGCFIGTGRMRLTFPEHGFNSIVSIQKTNIVKRIEITTLLDHGLETGDEVVISNTNCTPVITGKYIITKLTIDKFIITIESNTLSLEGDYGFLAPNQDFYLYNSNSVGGIPLNKINNQLFTIDRIIDKDSFEFFVTDAYSDESTRGGGEGVRISSSIHGFAGTHNNLSADNTLVRPLQLSGENYAFLCCPTLSNVFNTGTVTDIFAKVKLSQPPGTIIFDQFVSTPKTFDNGLLTSLNTLFFQVKIHDNILYEFNDVDFSFTLEIEEVFENLVDSLISPHVNVNMLGLKNSLSSTS